MTENYLQITGKTYLEAPLKKGKEYSIAFNSIAIYGADERDGNGEQDKITYKGKSVSDVTVIGEKDIIFGHPQKGSLSKKLRDVMFRYYEQQEAGNYQNFEQFYTEKMMEKIEEYKSKLI